MDEGTICGRLRVIRGAFRPRGIEWRPFVVEGTASTNRLWRGSGPCGEWLLKWYRYPKPGVHPESETAEFFRDQHCEGVAEFGARLDREGADGWSTVAFVQRWLCGASVWDRVVAAMRSGSPEAVFAGDLGRAVGGLHRILASGTPGSSFGAESWCRQRRAQWIERISRGVSKFQTACSGDIPPSVDKETWERARSLCENVLHGWRDREQRLQELRVEGESIRIHGDLHLGQILEREGCCGPRRFVAVDFEGEPTRTIAERRAKDLPLRDVAGMFRSFAYAAAVAGVSQGIAAHWSAMFLEGWREIMPLPSGEWRVLLDALIWEKAIYEAEYELSHRPDWLWIPLSVFSEKF